MSDTTLNTSPCASAQTIGRGLTAGTTVVATDTKVLNDKRWIQIGRAWACTTDIVTGAVSLGASRDDRKDQRKDRKDQRKDRKDQRKDRKDQRKDRKDQRKAGETKSDSLIR